MARLNVQGLARRDPGLMRCIKPLDGHTTVSLDLAAGEPTVTTHFSQDPYYRYATFDGVGKDPYYKNGVLMISDIYLMTMSVSPIGRDLMWKTFHSGVDGRPFIDVWREDPDRITKGVVKKERELHKAICLGYSYGMGPKKTVKQCYEKGYDMDLKTARDFYKSYWDLFKGVRRLSVSLGNRVKRDGYIVNPFGYRLTPNAFKALNFYVQSSVSGIMHIFNAKLFAIAPYAKFVTVIHDEVICDVPIDRIEDFRKAKEIATESLNDDLKWTVKIRTGFVFGGSWYEAK
jgi:DNA polymerase family A